MTISLEIGAAQKPARGERICGDSFHVIEGNVSTIALVDGLGHGPDAAVAASAFIEVLINNVVKSVDEIITDATLPMSKTRGAAVALVRIDNESQTLEFCGVGNIELKARSREKIDPFSMPGIVGRPVRRLNVFKYNLCPGDLIVAYSDGISSRFRIGDYADIPPREMAARILAEQGKNHDDATCIAIKVNDQ